MIKSLEQRLWDFVKTLSPRGHDFLFLRRRPLKYVMAGGTAACVDVGMLYLLRGVFHFHLISAIAGAFLFGFCASFILQKFWAFEDASTDRVRAQATLYFLVSAVNFFLNIIFVYLLAEKLGVHYIAAKILVSGTIAFASFFIYKFFIFTSISFRMAVSHLLYKKIPDVLVLACIALVVYIPLLAFFTNIAERQVRRGANPALVFPVHGSDSAGYVALSEGMITNHVFSQSGTAPFAPDTFRTPGYPGMLAVWKLLFGSYTLFPFFQILLTIVTSFLILRMGEMLWGRVVGVVAAGMFLLDPTVIFHSMVLLSDIPFTFFTVLSIFVAFFTLKKQKQSSRSQYILMFLSGTVLGISVLVRPISMYVPFIFLPAYFLLSRRAFPLKRILCASAFFFLGLLLVVSPWLVRNKIVANTWGLSSVAAFNLFHYYVPEFLAYKEHTTPDTFRLKMQADVPAGLLPSAFADIENTKTLNAVSMKYLEGNVFSYGVFHLVKTIPVFLSSGIKHVLFYYNDALGYEAYHLNTGNMTSFLLQGKFGDFLKELRISWLPTLESLYLFLVTLLALVPLLFSKKEKSFVVWFWALILYFSLLVGSVAYARFRLPLAPFLFLLAAYGATIGWQYLQGAFHKIRRI